MDAIEAIKTRHSVRVFRKQPVPKEVIEEVLQVALRAPSWANTQPWEVFAVAGEPLERIRSAYIARYESDVPPAPDLPGVKSWPPAYQERINELLSARCALQGLDFSRKEDRKKFGEANYRFFDAPMVVWLCLDKALTPAECGCGWPLYDLGAFSLALMLAAQARGLGSIPAFSLAVYPDLIRAETGIPDNLAIAVGIALGYEDETAALNSFRSTRREYKDVVKTIGF